MTKNKHLKAKINKLYIYTKTPVPKTYFFGIFSFFYHFPAAISGLILFHDIVCLHCAFRIFDAEIHRIF